METDKGGLGKNRKSKRKERVEKGVKR